MTTGALIWIALFIIGVVLFFFYAHTRRFFRCLLFTAFTGLGALGLVWLLGRFLDLGVAITPLTLGVSGLLGIPGVLCMLVLHLI